MPSAENILDFMAENARQAGDILLSYTSQELTRNIKSNPNDFSTEADHASEKFILANIKKYFPQDAIIAEESGSQAQTHASHTWIVDPLDGTHNFATKNEDFGVMIARADEKGLEAAVIYIPLKDILIMAAAKEGTFINGQKIDIAQYNIDEKPLSAARHQQAKLTSIGNLTTNMCAAINTFLTVTGERRGYVDGNPFVWDCAAPVLILSEAGFTVSDFSGQPYDWQSSNGVIAAKPVLHQKLVALLT